MLRNRGQRAVAQWPTTWESTQVFCVLGCFTGQSLFLQPAALPSCGDLGRQIPRTKAFSRMQQIVCPTEQTNIPHVAEALLRKRLHMVEVEKRPRCAPPPIGRNERTLSAITTVNLSPHHCRQVASALAFRPRVSHLNRGFPWTSR